MFPLFFKLFVRIPSFLKAGHAFFTLTHIVADALFQSDLQFPDLQWNAAFMAEGLSDSHRLNMGSPNLPY